jgi:hypothetical protein
VLVQLESLETWDFYDHKHKVVFEAVRNLEVAGKPIDVVTLENEIERVGKLDAIGGVAFLGELALRVPTVDNVIAYQAIVRDHAQARKILEETSEAAERMRRQPEDAPHFASALRARLAELCATAEQRTATRTVCLADVEPEHVRWLWAGRVPSGHLTLIDGDPGLGKSTLTLDLVARVTTGAPMPDEPAGVRRPPAAVVLMTAEDHPATTIRPRLDAAGADVRRVHAITAMPRARDPEAPPTLAPEDVARLELVIREHHAALVIVDPLMAYLPGDIDAYRDQDVRRTLRPLAAVAERTGAAIVIVRHLRKGSGSALYRGGGSIGIVGAARSALMVAAAPREEDAPDDGVRVIAPVKSNLGPMAPALRWRLVDTGGVARIEWLGVADGVTADALAAPPPARSSDGKLDAAINALRDVLSEGPVAARQAHAMVIEMVGCGERTVEAARARLGVEPIRVRTPDGRRVARVDLRLPIPQSSAPCGVDASGPAKQASRQDDSERGLPRMAYPAADERGVDDEGDL